MASKPLQLLLILLIISPSLTFKNDYELLLTYKKYLKVMKATPPAQKYTLVDMLETTIQSCMKSKLNIRDSKKIPDSEVERKVFSMTRIVTGKSREMKEAYAIMLAAPLCNFYIEEYFKYMFEDLMELFKSDFYEDHLDCFRKYDINNYETSDEDCTEIFGEFTKHYYLDQIDLVRDLIDNHDYPYCIENVAIKNAMYNYKAVIYANTNPYGLHRIVIRNEYVEMMKDSNQDALDCILMDLNSSKIDKFKLRAENEIRKNLRIE
jgi:hypothetical protein